MTKQLQATEIPTVLVGKGRPSRIISQILFCTKGGKTIWVHIYDSDLRTSTGPNLVWEQRLSPNTLKDVKKYCGPNTKETEELEKSFTQAFEISRR